MVFIDYQKKYYPFLIAALLSQAGHQVVVYDFGATRSTCLAVVEMSL